MIREELWIKKGEEWLQVDLASPSGITLEFRSNLLADLSKITSSHSYTFTLPLTGHNKRVFDNADDMRSVTSIRHSRLAVKYFRDGVELAENARLYVSAIKGGYECVMTWDVCDGLKELSEHDMSIRDLLTAEDDCAYHDNLDNEHDDVFYVGDNFTSAFEFNDNDIIRSMHDAGTSAFHYVNGSAPVYDERTGRWVTSDVGVSEAPPQGAVMIPPFAPPVMKVSRIVDQINKRFGTNFKFKGTFYRALGLPFTKQEMSPAMVRQSYMAFPTNTFVRDDGSVYMTPSFHKSSWESEFPLTVSNDHKWVYFSGVHRWGKLARLRLSGYVKIKTTEYLSGDDLPCLEIVASLHSEETVVAKATALSKIAFTGQYLDDGYLIEMREELGADVVDSDPIFPTSALYLRVTGGAGHNTWDFSHLRISVVYDEGWSFHYINVWHNLPDISCLEFMKSLFFVLGGFPKVLSDGSIVLSEFSDLQINKMQGKVYDWSSRLIVSDSQQSTDEIQPVPGNYAQKNYYLMKNEEIDSYGAPVMPSRNEDAFRSRYACLRINDENLDRHSTVINLPYYGAFRTHGKRHLLYTGDTQDYWTISDDSWSAHEAKPMLGLFKYRQTANKGNMISIEIWQYKHDLLLEYGFYYLQQILATPLIAKTHMRLNVLDLKSLDYSKPVYIEQFNSYFAIEDIKMSADSNISEVSFIKLPAISEPFSGDIPGVGIVPSTPGSSDTVDDDTILELSVTMVMRNRFNLRPGMVINSVDMGTQYDVLIHASFASILGRISCYDYYLYSGKNIIEHELSTDNTCEFSRLSFDKSSDYDVRVVASYTIGNNILRQKEVVLPFRFILVKNQGMLMFVKVHLWYERWSPDYDSSFTDLGDVANGGEIIFYQSDTLHYQRETFFADVEINYVFFDRNGVGTVLNSSIGYVNAKCTDLISGFSEQVKMTRKNLNSGPFYARINLGGTDRNGTNKDIQFDVWATADGDEVRNNFNFTIKWGQ